MVSLHDHRGAPPAYPFNTSGWHPPSAFSPSRDPHITATTPGSKFANVAERARLVGSAATESARQHMLGPMLVHSVVSKIAGGGPGDRSSGPTGGPKGKPGKGPSYHIVERRRWEVGSWGSSVSRVRVLEGLVVLAAERGMYVWREMVVVQL